MIICECILLTIIFVTGLEVVRSDMKTGIIRNRILAIASIAGLCVNVVYYCFLARPYLYIYLLNAVIMAVVSIFLFIGHYWAAGDSKLLICLTLLIPGRLYDQCGNHIPGINYLIIIFLLAYLFVVLESVSAWLGKEKAYRVNHFSFRSMPTLLIQLFFTFCILSTLSMGLQFVFRDFYNDNVMVFSLLNIVIITVLVDANIMNNKAIYAVFTLAFLAITVLGREAYALNWRMIVRNFLIIIISIYIRYFVNGYNYREILTRDIKPGMILAFSSIVVLQKSRIKGLPLTTTEDMRSRIDNGQAEAIIKWGASKSGNATIMIVRKVPFAVFIVLGIILYIIMRVVL